MMAGIENSIFGYNFPYLTPDTVLPPQSGLRIIKNDLKQLLLTSPGERVMRPNFGTGLRRFTFQQLDNQSINEIRGEIEQSIQIFEKRVELTDIIFNASPDESVVEISVLTRLTEDPNQQLSVEIFFPATLPDEARDQRGIF